MAEADLSSRRASRLRRLTACRQANSSVKIGSGRESFKKVQLAFLFWLFLPSQQHSLLQCLSAYYDRGFRYDTACRTICSPCTFGTDTSGSSLNRIFFFGKCYSSIEITPHPILPSSFYDDTYNHISN
ncbi:uncharacterized protein BO95DRAFT_213836 [Aspergillus brunneoviolaceus CBS 621.78]|uniref:Uncharacterized protein n=1 Tax=Aspergillus brunneoviolaceus CBS 621.78 TaxID=1450534 RepID=A0ACD1G254_9EURO|nr:hypothetical protein BO95DRAFT_213836 [Aspergillus brunneoviolaceus CBS 621.78]RAH43315.1 hypothetical protein BO95DRAFT_213836 [Aspergillus brunneoviolaceus CBS 621.78]